MTAHTDRSNRKTLLVYVGVFASGIYIGWSFMLKPALDDLHRLRARIASESQKTEILRSISGAQDNIRRQEALLSDAEEVTWLIETVNRIAEDAGVQILSVMPQDAETAGAYQRLPLQIEARSGYHEMGRFLSRVESHEKLVKVLDLRLENPNDARAGDTQSLRVTLALSAFSRKQAGA